MNDISRMDDADSVTPPKPHYNAGRELYFITFIIIQS